MKFCLNHPNRRVFSKGLCLECYKKEYQKPLKRTPLKKKPFIIRKVSKNQETRLSKYFRKRKIFFSKPENKLCRIQLTGCTRIATELHHGKGKEGDLLLDERWWIPACANCHRKVTDESKKAIEEGNSYSRHKKE